MKKTYIYYLINLLLITPTKSAVDVYAGLPITIKSTDLNTTKKCTVSFAVFKDAYDIGGMLTSAQCLVSNIDKNEAVYLENEEKYPNIKGNIQDMQFGGDSGLDYAYINFDSALFNPTYYVVGLTSSKSTSEIILIDSSSTPIELGIKVCGHGIKSGYRCGNLTEFGLELEILDPWTKNQTVILRNVSKVDMGVDGFAPEDIGGPVYSQNENSGTLIAKALGHIVNTNNDDPNHKVLYYMPIDGILANINKRLLICQCTTSQENLKIEEKPTQAQIEIPAK